jgi:hypothetical protein
MPPINSVEEVGAVAAIIRNPVRRFLNPALAGGDNFADTHTKNDISSLEQEKASQEDTYNGYTDNRAMMCGRFHSTFALKQRYPVLLPGSLN